MVRSNFPAAMVGKGKPSKGGKAPYDPPEPDADDMGGKAKKGGGKKAPPFKKGRKK